MEISPEERRKIYEEEKIRIEQEAKSAGNQSGSSLNTSTGLPSNVEALLCYVGAWVTGIIFLILEQKSMTVRFHATRSILVFGPLSVAGWIMGWIPVSGGISSAVVSILSFVLWIVLMVRAYRDEEFEIPVVSDLARQMIGAPETPAHPIPVTQTKEIENTSSSQVRSIKGVPGSRSRRLIGSSLAIAWSSVLLVFMNYYHQYIAIYHGQTSNGVTIWIRDPIFNQDIHQWLPLLNIALFASILGNIITIVWDKYLLRDPIKILIDVFALGAVIGLVSIFPFDFSSFSDSVSIDATRTGVTLLLIFVAISIGVGLLIRLIKLIVNVARGTTSYQ